jgi:long-chain acyl-CoA synthetase
MFLHYHNAPEQTRQVLRDGWFYSGDNGSLTEDRQIVFIDRKQDIMQLPGGEILAPQFIESRLKFSPYIKDAWVISEPDNPVIGAIIIINYANIGRWAGRNKIAYTTFSDLSQKREVYELIKQDIIRINQDISPGCRITRYANLHKEFDADEGELTKDRKMRRPFLKERYMDLTKAVLQGQSLAEITLQMQYRDGRTGVVKITVAIEDLKEGNV